MQRNVATKSLRDLLDEQGLSDWHIRLTVDMTKPFLGMCSYKDKTIILNAFHIDTHPDIEITDTIKHEVAHALCPGHGHDDVWRAKAKELGCKDLSPCSSLSLSPEAIDAIRSGADLTVEFTERVVRDVNYKVSRLQDKCSVCGKVAKIESQMEFKDSKTGKRQIMKWLVCGHFEFVDSDSKSDFEDMVFDGDVTCKHSWDMPTDARVKYKTICGKCNAKRLYPYQIEGARFLEKANGRAAIFDEMGLGKTAQALAWMKYNLDKAIPYLWVTKSAIKYPHAREIIRILGVDYFPQILTSGRQQLIPGMKGYLVSYDMFRRIDDLSQFEKAGIKSLILDEVQSVKNPDSSRTQCIRKVAKTIPSIIPLSGTPWKNRGSEFFVCLNLLDPKLFWSFEGFKRQWVDYHWEGNKKKEGGIANPKRFKEAIKHLAIRRERTEVMPELPIVSRTRLLCEVPEHARQVYDKEKKHLLDIWNNAVIGGEEDSFETQSLLNQSLMIMRQIVGIAKVDSTMEWVTDFLEDNDRKLVVFVQHIECGRLLKLKLDKWCEENGYPEVLQLTGGSSPELKMSIQDKFNGPNHRLMIASALSSGEGLNLQTCCDCVLHERQWNPANEEQCESRFIRIGQQSNFVNAQYMHGDKTVDTTFDGIVERKRIYFHNAMNKGEIPQWDEKSMIKELVAAIVAEEKANAA